MLNKVEWSAICPISRHEETRANEKAKIAKRLNVLASMLFLSATIILAVTAHNIMCDNVYDALNDCLIAVTVLVSTGIIFNILEKRLMKQKHEITERKLNALVQALFQEEETQPNKNLDYLL